MSSNVFKKMFFGVLVFLIGLGSPFLTDKIQAIYDQQQCNVAHSGTNNTCLNVTYGYKHEGGGQFMNYHKHWYTGYSNSIYWTKQRWDPENVTAGNPYYHYAWISDPTAGVHYYGRDLSTKLLSQIPGYLDFYIKKTVSLKGQSTLRIGSNLNAAYYNMVNYDAITYPR